MTPRVIWSGTLDRQGRCVPLVADGIPSVLAAFDTAPLGGLPLMRWQAETDSTPANWTLGNAETHRAKSRYGAARRKAQGAGVRSRGR